MQWTECGWGLVGLCSPLLVTELLCKLGLSPHLENEELDRATSSQIRCSPAVHEVLCRQALVSLLLSLLLH